MKKTILVISTICLSFHLYGQTNTFPSSGGVGINTLSPNALLNISGQSGVRGILLDLKENPQGSSSPMIIWDSRNGGADYLFFARQDSNNLSFKRYTSIWANGLDLLTIKGENGNVGIGTTNPISKLHLRSSSGQDPLLVQITGNTKFYVNSNGGSSFGSSVTPPDNGLYVDNRINIGTSSSNAFAKLNIKQGWGDWIHFENTSNNGFWAFYNEESQESFNVYYKRPNNTIVYPLKIKTDGSIETSGILVAQLNASQINSKELRLDVNNVADYVFQDDYKLRTLLEVEQFVKENKHLPGIPKGSDLKKEGMNVAEMNNLILEKVEELTLYLIELKKENEELRNEFEILTKKGNSLNSSE